MTGFRRTKKSFLIAVLTSSAICTALTVQSATANSGSNMFVPPMQKIIDPDSTPFDFSKYINTNIRVGGSWTQLGAGSSMVPNQLGRQAVSGRVSSIAVAQNGTNSTIYLGSAQGGVWSSTDNGSSWKPLTDNQVSLSTGSVAVDPNNSKVIYVGTGEQHFSADSRYGKGILKSVDGGQTWTLLGADVFGGQHIGKVTVDPHDSQSVWVAADRGIYHSTDGGTTWKTALSFIHGFGRTPMGIDVYVDSNSPGTIYANYEAFGIYKSTDGGVTWNCISSTWSQSLHGYHSAAMAVVEGTNGTPDTLYASTVSGDGNSMGMYVSKDGGTTWTELTNVPQYFDANFSFTGVYDPNHPSGQGPYDNVIAVDPTNPLHILAGGLTLIESKDGGKSWTVMDTFLDKSHAPIADISPAQHAITFDDKGDAYIGDDGGIYEETASGQWRNLNTNLSTTMFNSGMSVINQGTTVLAGTQGSGTLLYNKTTGWNQVFGGTGGYTYVDPRNQNVMFAESQFGNIVRSNDGGVNWIPWKPGYVDNQGIATASFITPFTVRPLNGKNRGSYDVLVGSSCVSQVSIDGSTYQALSPNFTFGGDDPLIDSATVLSQSQLDPNIVYVGTINGQVWVSFNAESSYPHWTCLTSALTDPNNYPDGRAYVSSIVINPLNPKEITIAYGSPGGGSAVPFVPSTNNLVYCIKDTSLQTPVWTNVTGNLPVSYVDSALYVGPYVLVGTDQGVYAARSGSSNWTDVGTGLPNVSVTNIVQTTAGLVVGTYGRGAFQLNLPQELGSLLQTLH